MNIKTIFPVLLNNNCNNTHFKLLMKGWIWLTSNWIFSKIPVSNSIKTRWFNWNIWTIDSSCFNDSLSEDTVSTLSQILSSVRMTVFHNFFITYANAIIPITIRHCSLEWLIFKHVRSYRLRLAVRTKLLFFRYYYVTLLLDFLIPSK